MDVQLDLIKADVERVREYVEADDKRNALETLNYILKQIEITKTAEDDDGLDNLLDWLRDT